MEIELLEPDIPQHLVCDHCLSTVFGHPGFKLACQSSETKNAFSYTTTVQQIVASASQGCNWCRLILNQPDAFEELNNTDTVDVDFQLGGLDEHFDPKGNNRYFLLVNGWRLHLTAFTDELDPSAKFVTARELRHQVDSPDAFQQARSWIEECNHHNECAGQEKHKLPTRVIEVAPATESAVPRLLQTCGMSDYYAALSYCWGMEQPCVTRVDNIQSHLIQLPMNAVARTIRDAIKCTRQLGIKYLWVDAFCIIQDCKEDKIRELASMRQVYQEAHVTIVASTAADATQGFLGDRPPPQPSYKVPVWTPDGTPGTMSLRPEGWYSQSQEPVNGRAWTLEEKLLSRRLLIYASHTMQWQCQTHMKNWANSMLIPAGSTALRLPGAFTRPVRRRSPHESRDQDDQREEEMKIWMDVISEYSVRTSTLPEDRLIALGGMAEEYHLRYQVNYLAGLWEGPLLPALLMWQASEYARSNEEMYLAPTWSWAALKSPVSYRTGLYSKRSEWYDVELLDASIDLKSERLSFGRVTTGFLKLQAHIKEGWYEPPQYLSWTGEKGAAAVPTDVNVSTDDRMGAGPVICLAIARQVHTYDDDNTVAAAAIHGLLIAPAQRPGEYQRVGCFFGADEHDFTGSPRHKIILI